MDADAAYRKWAREANRNGLWSQRELRDFYQQSHVSARGNALGYGTTHIDGRCPAHCYAVCQCDECLSRPRHAPGTSGTKTQAQIEAEAEAERKALYETIASEIDAENAAYALEYDNVPVVAEALVTDSSPHVALEEASKRRQLIHPRKSTVDVGKKLKAPVRKQSQPQSVSPVDQPTPKLMPPSKKSAPQIRRSEPGSVRSEPKRLRKSNGQP